MDLLKNVTSSVTTSNGILKFLVGALFMGHPVEKPFSNSRIWHKAYAKKIYMKERHRLKQNESNNIRFVVFEKFDR